MKFDCAIRIAGSAVMTSLTVAGCLDPEANGPAATAQTGAGVPAADPRDARLVIWDGARIHPRVVGVGRNGRLDFWDGGKGWADCESKPTCKADLAAKDGAGVKEKKGLRFHAEGTGWAGFGWSWFGWTPPTAGTDISAYRSLTFEIRVEARSPDTAPDKAMVAVLLGCSNGKKTTARAMVGRYDDHFDDGSWHEIVIPMADLLAGDGAAFDPSTAWEFQLSTWAATPRDFEIDIDQIAVEK